MVNQIISHILLHLASGSAVRYYNRYLNNIKHVFSPGTSHGLRTKTIRTAAVHIFEQYVVSEDCLELKLNRQ